MLHILNADCSLANQIEETEWRGKDERVAVNDDLNLNNERVIQTAPVDYEKNQVITRTPL